MDQEKKTRVLAEEDFPENFPTSARPIFRAVALLVLIVAILCYVTYACSEKDPAPGVNNRQAPGSMDADDAGESDDEL